MMNLALLTALIALAPLSASSPASIGAEELARGFGQSTPRLIAAVEQLEALGLPVTLRVRLSKADGAPLAEQSLQAAWRDDESSLRTDAEGCATLRIDARRLGGLRLGLPDGTRTEVGIDYLEAIGFRTYCPSSEASIRATGC